MMQNNKLAYRGVWISFLEYEKMDFSNPNVFLTQCQTIVKNCADIGINTLIVHVRPFSDAFYKSSLFPTSHLISGTQGKKIDWDPLQIMLDTAHQKNLRVEAWINPYRVKPPMREFELSADNPASRWMHEDKDKTLKRVTAWEKGLYFNPASEDARKLIADGVAEIVQNYAVDGVQFDDYFYPTADPAFDHEWWQAKNDSYTNLGDWRRHQVDLMVAQVYKRIKSIRPEVVFGISPQGNTAINYSEQHCDIQLWMQTPGYMDYVMPQLYWGFHRHDTDPKARHFAVSLQEWAAMKRLNEVALYIGIGPYLLGTGDSQVQFDQSEWKTGHCMADMVKEVAGQAGAQGFTFFRYDSLFKPEAEYQELLQTEIKNLKETLMSLY